MAKIIISVLIISLFIVLQLSSASVINIESKESKTTVVNIIQNETELFHNNLSGIQGGLDNERYHIRESWYNELSSNIFNWITNSVNDLTNYFTKTEIEDSYFDKSEIIGFGYYNLSDFDISDYFTSSQIESFDYYNNTNFPYTALSNFTNNQGFWNDTYATFNKTFADGLYVPYTGATQNVNLGNNNFTVNGTTLHVDVNTGRVGIGTTSPTSKLHIRDDSGSSPAQYTFSGNVTSGYTTIFSMNDIGLTMGHGSTSRDLRLQTGSTPRLTILGGGNVGIGTTTPQQRLHVNGSAVFNGTLTINNGTAAQHAVTLAQLQAINSTVTGDFVPYTGASQSVNLNDRNLTNVQRLGIGTDSPGARLHVAGETWLNVMPGFEQEGSIRVGRSDNPGIRYHSIVARNTGSPASNWIRFDIHAPGTTTDQREVMILRGDGNVGIGTTTPGARLDINVTSAVASPGLRIDKASAINQVALFVRHKTGVDTRGIADFQNNDGSVMYIRGDGNVGIGTTIPQTKLHVVGNVTINGTVFAEDYVTMSKVWDETKRGSAIGLIVNPNTYIKADGTLNYESHPAFVRMISNVTDMDRPETQTIQEEICHIEEKIIEKEVIKQNGNGEEGEQETQFETTFEEVCNTQSREVTSYPHTKEVETKGLSTQIRIMTLERQIYEQNEIIKDLISRIEALEGEI